MCIVFGVSFFHSTHWLSLQLSHSTESHVLFLHFSPEPHCFFKPTNPRCHNNIMSTLRVAEDCAGLATGTFALKRTIDLMQKQAQKRSKKGVSGKKINVDTVYMSELDRGLNSFLKATFPTTKIVRSSEIGVSDKGDKLLGVDGKTDIYLSGGCCVPFSKIGKNAGIADKRAETTRDSVNFIIKRRPKFFILEQVKNVVSSKHRAFWGRQVVRRLHNIRQRTSRKQTALQAL